MSQQNIDFGSFPDDPSADAIRTAFQKAQNNFNELYSTARNTVNSVTGGAGIVADPTIGNVFLRANVYQVSLASSTGLRFGFDPSGSLPGANYTSGSQTLYINLPNNLSITGNISSQNFNIFSTNAQITANGLTQSDATGLSKTINGVTTANSGEGVRLPTPAAGMILYVINTSGNTINVFPSVNGIVDSLGANNPYTQNTNTTVSFIATSQTQWYSK